MYHFCVVKIFDGWGPSPTDRPDGGHGRIVPWIRRCPENLMGAYCSRYILYKTKSAEGRNIKRERSEISEAVSDGWRHWCCCRCTSVVCDSVFAGGAMSAEVKTRLLKIQPQTRPPVAPAIQQLTSLTLHGSWPLPLSSISSTHWHLWSGSQRAGPLRLDL